MRAICAAWALCVLAACGSGSSGVSPSGSGSSAQSKHGSGSAPGSSSDASAANAQGADDAGGQGQGDAATSSGGTDGAPMPVSQQALITIPNPIVSRGKPVTSSVGGSSTVMGSKQPLSTVNDGVFTTGDGFEAPVSAGTAPWVAINVGAGPTRLMLTWLTEDQPNTPVKPPVDYHIDVSADGSTWKTVVSVTGNNTNAREDSFDFGGQSWVRIATTKADSSGSVHFVEIEAYDISKGHEDTWVFLGDSITALAMNRFVSPDFATLVNQSKTAFTPMVVDDAIGGTTTSDCLQNLSTSIARFPDVDNFAVAYGTNDSWCDLSGAGVSDFKGNLTMIVDQLKAAGKRVIVPHIPWNQPSGCSMPTLLAPYNAAIDALRATDPFFPGPDLYTFVSMHQNQLDDGVHPNDTGVASFNTLWSQAVLPLYP